MPDKVSYIIVGLLIIGGAMITPVICKSILRSLSKKIKKP